LAFFTPVERSTAHLLTLGQPKAKPSQNQTKPNQAGLLLLLLALLLMILNQQTKSSLLTYCFALTNKQTNKQTKNQPTNQPTPLPPPTQNKQIKPTTNKNKRVCSRFKPQKQNTPPFLPPSLPPSPLTNP
jgi:hypothetical protein